MTTCQSCGKQNPPDQDFCSCGEYLRWEPTGFHQAITPELAAQAAAEGAAPASAPPAEPPSAPAAPPASPGGAHVMPAVPRSPGNGQGNGHAATPAPPAPPASTAPVPVAPPPAAASIPAVSKTLIHGAVPPPQAPQQSPVPEHEPATIVLRLPDGDPAKGETLHQAVDPGQRDRVLALVRNQSGIVDNYDLGIEGLPQDWYSIYPGTVYLVPFGSGGTYEQEVEIHLHPPRGPEAEARVWELRVVAHSKAHDREAASAPLALHILPYIETTTALRPQRKKGRRKATYDVAVSNKANASVLAALEGTDPDGELQFGFNRPPQEIPPGATVISQMRVKPPKQIWIGRAQDRRMEVLTVTGEEAAERAAAEPLGAEVLAHEAPAGKRGLFRRRSAPRVPGVYGPRIYKPQIYPPDMNIGPGGITIRKPTFTKPQVQGPQMGSFQASQLKPGQLKLPGRGGAAAPQAALLPTQGVFRQKPWIPWWAVPVVALLLLLALLLHMLSPTQVLVPKVIGEKSAFTAEKKLNDAKLKLDPNQKTQVDDKDAPGTVVGQTPTAGKKAKKGELVTVLIAVGSGKVDVPNIVGLNAGAAEKALRAKNLTLGQASPQPVDPNGKIVSQIPAAKEVVKAGTPVNIFYPDPSAADAKKKVADAKKKGGAAAADAAAAAAAAAAGKGAKDILLPAVAGAKVDTYAKKIADLGVVPETSKQFNNAVPGTLFATDPPGGTKVAKGQKVKLLISVGQPQVVFSNGKDILRIDGANGKKFPPVADSTSAIEKDPTYSADGTHVAYTSDGQVFLVDLTKKNSAPIALTPAGVQYSNLAWAPVADRNVLALERTDQTTGDSDLCLSQITKDLPITVNCIVEPDFTVSRSLHWSPEGTEILGFGVKEVNTFGIVRWKAHQGKAFSADIADWSKGHFVTDISKPRKGALDAAISPDGKQMAIISNEGTAAFRLWLVKRGDFLLTDAKPTPDRACKVTYRGDGKEVMIVQADALCQEEVGSLLRVSVADVNQHQELSPVGNDPVYQPFTLGG
jgi:beta-lactam-binding protein with PASTA domain